MVLWKKRVDCSWVMVLDGRRQFDLKTSDEHMEDEGARYQQTNGVGKMHHSSYTIQLEKIREIGTGLVVQWFKSKNFVLNMYFVELWIVQELPVHFCPSWGVELFISCLICRSLIVPIFLQPCLLLHAAGVWNGQHYWHKLSHLLVLKCTVNCWELARTTENFSS